MKPTRSADKNLHWQKYQNVIEGRKNILWKGVVKYTKDKFMILRWTSVQAINTSNIMQNPRMKPAQYANKNLHWQKYQNIIKRRESIKTKLRIHNNLFCEVLY